ncbi:MAG: LLM class flavin-dependent oxidoreductase, partial [Chloroflexota bacterium]
GERQARQVHALIELAEITGFRSVWAGDQYIDHPSTIHLPAPLLVLANLASQTSLRLGTGILVLPAYQPLRLAYEAALLDRLSEGRLTLGVGVGSPQLAQRFGVEPAQVGDFIDDALAALRALWRGSDGFQGKMLTIEGGIHPLPLTPGGPPVWVAGTIGRSVRRAARWGDGWYAGMHYSYETIVRQVARYRDALTAEGKDASQPTVAMNRLLVLAPTRDEALEAGGAAVEPAAIAADVPSQFVGTPAQVAATIRQYASAGVTNMQFRVLPASMSYQHAARTMRLFADEVLPMLG